VDCQVRGKLAYVNTGAYGIGEAVADLLTREGTRVIVVDKDEAVLRKRPIVGTAQGPPASLPYGPGYRESGRRKRGARLVLAKHPEGTKLNWRCDAGHTHSIRK